MDVLLYAYFLFISDIAYFSIRYRLFQLFHGVRNRLFVNMMLIDFFPKSCCE